MEFPTRVFLFPIAFSKYFFMRGFLFVVAGVFGAPSLVEVDQWLKNTDNTPEMMQARKEEVSFLEQTLHSMEFNQQEVLKSNRDLDKQVRESTKKLNRITDEVNIMNQRTRDQMNTAMPFSLLQTGDYEDDASVVVAKAGGPMSVLQAADARAAASEKRFHDAMKKLESDREALLKDERMRRARAQQERRHIQV